MRVTYPHLEQIKTREIQVRHISNNFKNMDYHQSLYRKDYRKVMDLVKLYNKHADLKAIERRTLIDIFV
jgi:hypothetical protein